MSTTRAMAHCLQSKFVFGKVESGQAWSTGRKCNRKILQDSLLSWPHSSQWLESGKIRLISACHLLFNPQAQPAGDRLPDPLQVRSTPVLSSGEFQAKMFIESLSRKISLKFDHLQEDQASCHHSLHYLSQCPRPYLLCRHPPRVRLQVREQESINSRSQKRTQTNLSRESPLEAGSGMCKFFPVLFYGTIGASMLSLTMVTINRAAMLFFPEKVDRVKETRGHNVPVKRSEK